MSIYVTDTHPLVWYTGNKHNRLSNKALEAFEQADRGEAFIYIPAVVLWEAALLEKVGKVSLPNGFEPWANRLVKKNGFELVQLETGIIAQAVSFNLFNDPFDSAIMATAAHLKFPLITKDEMITTANLIEIYW